MYRDRLNLVLFVVRNNIDLDGSALAGFCVQFPQAKIFFVNDGFAVARNRREEEPPGFMLGDLDGASAVLRYLPDIIYALEHFFAAGLDVRLISQPVRDKIYVAV